MIEQELMHGELFVIRHKATHKLLQGYPDGRSHTRLALDNPSKVRTIPRLFDSEKGAKIALARWCEGVHQFHWEDGFSIRQPSVPRIKEDFEVVPVFMYTVLDKEKS